MINFSFIIYHFSFRPQAVLLSFLIFHFSFSPVRAQQDTAFQQLYQRYFQLYGESDAEKFYEASEQMKAYYLEKGNIDSYYKIRLNEVLYDAENGQTYSAIKKSNNILDEMEEKQEKQYHIVYTALGTIYESRGNYRMANHYYEEAMKDVAPADTGSMMSIYSRLASLQMAREPASAQQWNEKFGQLCQHFPDYYKVYLTLKGGICFFNDDRQTFDKTHEEFQQYVKEHPELDDYGVLSMQIIRAAFDGQYDKALNLIDTHESDFDNIKNFDFRIKIYNMMGRSDLAVSEANKRRDYRDSLNSDMIYNNINEVNAELGVAKINQQAAEEREMWLIIVIVLLVIVIAVGVAWAIWYRRINQRLQKQNHALEIALDRAEESDRMKTSFIEHVSHEIRTPLNVITGFAQIISNPEYELGTDERNNMLRDIGKNTNDITTIVNELLEVAQDESRNQYEKTDTINCQELMQRVMAEAQMANNGRLDMRLKNQLAADFTFTGNRQATEKVLRALLNNAMKFTQQGFVELSASLREPDRQLVFAVTDSGIGIPQEHYEHAFQRFFKVDSFKQGLGLGLTMSKKITELLGGSINIDKDYHPGCRMIVTLPLE
ncbi:MAG: hypothetical protein IJ527_04485 [Prevotella sp.]|nr:hypothetical protein [Prevotella sp.]